MKALVAAVVLAGCAPPERAVTDALAAYRRLIAAMDVDATVDLFAPSASISHATEPPIIGRPAIGAFLRTFAGYHVTDYELAATSTRVDGELAFQHGTYREEVDAPDGKHVRVEGVFDAAWKRQRDGAWRLTRMHTDTRPR